MIRKITTYVLFGCIGLGSLMIISECLIVAKTYDNNSSNITDIPSSYHTIVLPGTKKYIGSSDVINYYYQTRIDKVYELHRMHDIQHIIISGDNSSKDYDEPSTMKADLVSLGIPEPIIHLDYAGFSTLDSVLRAQKIFEQNNIIFVSQKFQNERAIVLGRFAGIGVYGLNAPNYTFPYGLRIKIRERFARLKMWGEIIFNFEPTVLGDPIPLNQ